MLKVIIKLTWFKLFDLKDDSGHTNNICEQVFLLSTVVSLSPAGTSSEVVPAFVEKGSKDFASQNIVSLPRVVHKLPRSIPCDLCASVSQPVKWG